MKKFIIQGAVLLVVIFGSLYFAFKDFDFIGQKLPGQTTIQTTKITVDNVTLNVELADTPSKRALGLGQKDSIASDSGMLFVFSGEGSYQFWMKGMRFPLDMIFIMENKIVGIDKNLPAPSAAVSDQDLPRYTSTTPFDKVLEVNAGFVEAHAIKVGDTISEM